MGKNIAIVGAGISGMSVAYLLMGQEHQITIYAKAFSPDITSNKAAAFWFPYHIRNDNRGIQWCTTSYDYYKKFSLLSETGISIQKLKKVLRTGVVEEEPIWIDFMPNGSYKTLPKSELPEGVSKIYEVVVPLIETQSFLPWLQQQLQQHKVKFIHQEITNLEVLADKYDILINCSGLGARQLCNDNKVIPVRGQVALLSPGAFSGVYLDNEVPLYVVPRKDAIIIGGTYEENVETETTEPAAISTILDNAYAALPVLRNQNVIGSWAGLRPFRNEVRVEREKDKNIIHNYGHGGSGFTLAFGCAESVCKLL